MQKRYNVLLVLIATMLLTKVSSSQIPRQISFQGYLKNKIGQAVTDTLSMTFSIYSDLNHHNLLWSENQQVIISRGIYNVRLGFVNPIPDSTFNGDIRYLGVKIADDPEMDQLVPILSVGYAFAANRAKFADSTNSVGHADSAYKANFADSASKAARADTAILALGIDSTIVINRAKYADNAGKSVQANTADLAIMANTAKFVEKAVLADTASKAARADIATLALGVNSTIVIDRAKYADSTNKAENAKFALNADMLDNKDSSYFASKTHLHDERYYTKNEANDSRMNTIDAKSLKGKEPGNGSDNIPINNGLLNINLNSDMVDNLHAGNQENQIAINNGKLNQNLNADLLDGKHASAFFDSLDSFKATLSDSGKISNPDNPVHWTKLRNVPNPIAEVTLEGFSGGGIEGSLTIRKNGTRVASEYLSDTDAISIESNPTVGIHVKKASGDGISIDKAGSNAVNIASSHYGINIKSAGAYGIYIDSAQSDGININYAKLCGLKIKEADENGIHIDNAQKYGIRARGKKGGGRFESADSFNYALKVFSYLDSSTNKALYVKGLSTFAGWAISDSGFASKLSNDNLFFSISSPNMEIFTSGTGKLNNGAATIQFDNKFSTSIVKDETLIKIIVTPCEQPAGLLYVCNKSPSSFDVKLQPIPGLENFSKDMSFDWLAIGRRK